MNKCNQCKCFNCLGEDKQTITVSIDTSNIQNQIDEAIRVANKNRDLINTLAEQGILVYQTDGRIRPIKEILHECVLAYLNITNK